MKSSKYARPADKLETLIEIILKTETGQTIIERMIPRLGSRLIGIEPYPEHIYQEVKAVLPEGHPIGACYFEHDRKIFVDFTGPKGIIAAYLVHEFALVLEGSEKIALKTQAAFTQELKELDKEYANFLTLWTYHAEALVHFVDDESDSSQAA
jgi:hypothetical protein